MEIDYPIHGSAGFDCRPKRKANRDMSPVHLEARAGSISSGSSADEHQNDLSSFKSDKPFLMLKMTSTYIQRSGVYISASFAKENLCKPGTSCDVTLQISSERFWIAQCIVSKNSGHRIYARVTGAGWKAFKEDNCLQERDVCVLEVIEERTLKVSIFRAKVKIDRQNEAN